MKGKSLLAITVALAVLLLGAVVFAQGRGYGRGGHMGYGHMGYYAPKDLQLSESQIAKIDKIRDAYDQKFITLQSNIRDLNVAIDNELAKEQPNEAKLNSLREKRAQTFENLNDLRDQMQKEIDGLLTEKQKEYYGNRGFGPHCTGGLYGGKGRMGDGWGMGSMHHGYWR